MSAFRDKFLRDGTPSPGWLRRTFGGEGPAKHPRVCLGAFGKHPGWDDHLDDIGLETETLALAKQVLYVEGIGGQLNAGSWDRLPPEQRLPGFAHVFLWRRDGQTLAGRLWSSVDRKKRDRYPMVVCAQIDDLPLAWTLDRVLPQLEAIEAACRSTHSADDVRALIDNGRAALNAEIPSDGTDPSRPADSGNWSPAWPAEWAAPDGAALRVLYRIRNHLSDYSPRRSADGVPREMRLSIRSEAPAADTLRSWTTAFDALLNPDAPALYLLPLDHPWMDIIVGEPATESFFALRASAETLPPVDQVPYTLTPEWSEKAVAFLAGLPPPNTVKSSAARDFWRLPTG